MRETALGAALKKAGVTPPPPTDTRMRLAPSPMEAFLRWFRFNVDKARGAGEFHFASYAVTPVIADYLLKNHNFENRPIDRAEVALIADILKKGDFRHTSQGISFSDEIPTRFNNGQHRCSAICVTGITATLTFCFGEPRENFSVIDTNMKTRNGSDTVAIAMPEVTNHQLVSAAALLYQRVMHSSEKLKLTNDEYLATLAELPTLVTHARYGMRIARKIKGGMIGVAATVALSIIVRDSKACGDDFETFVEELGEGYGLSKRSPVLTLRNTMMNGKLHEAYGGGRSYAMALVYAILVTWNAERSSQPGSVKRLFDYSKGEPFPKVK